MKYFILTTALVFSLMVPAYASHPGGSVSIDVNGLVCDFCARALEKVFGKQDAVDDINVNLDTKVISIHFKEGQNIDDETITSLIEDSGYNVKAIRHEP